MANITITHGAWTYARESRLRDLLWLIPMIIFGCGVC
jgi:hypothetical protein